MVNTAPMAIKAIPSEIKRKVGINIAAEIASTLPKWMSMGVTKVLIPDASVAAGKSAPNDTATNINPIKVALAVPTMK